MPDMQEQMSKAMVCMEEMNKAALDMMQKMYDQNCKMMNQFMEMMQSMGPGAGKAEKPAAEMDDNKAEVPGAPDAEHAEKTEAEPAEKAEAKPAAKTAASAGEKKTTQKKTAAKTKKAAKEEPKE
jgi:hypothetical protein